MKRFYCLVLIFTVLCSICISSAAGGSEQDPVLTKSYIDTVFLPDIMKKAEDTIERKFDAIVDNFSKKASEQLKPSGICALLLEYSGYKLESGSGSDCYSAPEGMLIGGGLGTIFTPVEGSFMAYLTANGALIDITEGIECYSNEYLKNGHSYLIASESGTSIAAARKSSVTIVGPYFSIGFGRLTHTKPSATIDPIVPDIPDMPNENGVKYKKYADALYKLGLFAGTDIGYELNREATRAESIVMLLRLLGELPTAQDHPVRYGFKDVPDWASHYVSYAYAMNYTAGMSEKLFGSTNKVTAAQYLTFVLRALGYKDVGVDFVWDQAGDYAVSIGLISEAENKAFSSRFYRDEMVLVSYRALNMNLKGSSVKLIDKLIALDIVNKDISDLVL